MSCPHSVSAKAESTLSLRTPITVRLTALWCHCSRNFQTGEPQGIFQSPSSWVPLLQDSVHCSPPPRTFSLEFHHQRLLILPVLLPTRSCPASFRGSSSFIKHSYSPWFILSVWLRWQEEPPVSLTPSRAPRNTSLQQSSKDAPRNFPHRSLQLPTGHLHLRAHS